MEIVVAGLQTFAVALLVTWDSPWALAVVFVCFFLAACVIAEVSTRPD